MIIADTPIDLSPHPTTIFWEVTNACNFPCAHCYNREFLNKRDVKISREQGLEICQKIVEEGFSHVVFLGGEPLADRNFLEYVRWLSSRGVSVAISTNGSLITEKKAADLAAMNVSLVSVSLDSGDRELNDRVRGDGTFGKIIMGLRILARHRNADGPRIAIACTLARENYGSYASLFALAEELEIADIFFNKFMDAHKSTVTSDSAAGFLEELLILCDAAAAASVPFLYLPIMPKVADMLSTRFGLTVVAKEQTCSAITESILLSDDMTLHPCSMARVGHGGYGMPINGRLRDALFSEGFAKFTSVKQALLEKLPNVCTSCVYRDDCAKLCPLTTDQTKYYLMCELLSDDRTFLPHSPINEMTRRDPVTAK